MESFTSLTWTSLRTMRLPLMKELTVRSFKWLGGHQLHRSPHGGHVILFAMDVAPVKSLPNLSVLFFLLTTGSSGSSSLELSSCDVAAFRRGICQRCCSTHLRIAFSGPYVDCSSPLTLLEITPTWTSTYPCGCWSPGWHPPPLHSPKLLKYCPMLEGWTLMVQFSLQTS